MFISTTLATDVDFKAAAIVVPPTTSGSKHTKFLTLINNIYLKTNYIFKVEIDSLLPFDALISPTTLANYTDFKGAGKCDCCSAHYLLVKCLQVSLLRHQLPIGPHQSEKRKTSLSLHRFPYHHTRLAQRRFGSFLARPGESGANIFDPRNSSDTSALESIAKDEKIYANNR